MRSACRKLEIHTVGEGVGFCFCNDSLNQKYQLLSYLSTVPMKSKCAVHSIHIYLIFSCLY